MEHRGIIVERRELPSVGSRQLCIYQEGVCRNSKRGKCFGESRGATIYAIMKGAREMKKNPGRKERRRLEHKNRIENGIKLQHMHIVEQRKEAKQRQKELNK